MDASLYLEGGIHFDSLFRLKQNPARNLGRVLFLYHIIYAFENEADSISFLSSALGVNRILFVVIPDESTSSAFSKPFEEKDSFTRPKFPSWILNPFFRYIGSFRTSDERTASTSVTFNVQASEMSFARSIIVSSSIYCGAA